MVDNAKNLEAFTVIWLPPDPSTIELHHLTIIMDIVNSFRALLPDSRRTLAMPFCERLSLPSAGNLLVQPYIIPPWSQKHFKDCQTLNYNVKHLLLVLVITPKHTCPNWGLPLLKIVGRVCWMRENSKFVKISVLQWCQNPHQDSKTTNYIIPNPLWT